MNEPINKDMSHRGKRKVYMGRSRQPCQRRYSTGKPAVSSKERKKQKNDFIFLPFLFFTGVVIFGLYFFYGKKKASPEPVNQMDTEFTVDERIKRKQAGIKLQQDIQSQKVLAEKFKEPVGKIDPLEPELSPLDMGVSVPDNASMKSVFKELDEKPFENDLHQDPEDVIRRQIVHRDWMEEYLEKRNEQEKKEFIRQFIQTAQEQGYNVYFTEDMQVILEPIDPEEQKEEDFDEVQINWK